MADADSDGEVGDLDQVLCDRRSGVPDLPEQLQGVGCVESIHDAVLRGHTPDTHRFLRTLARVAGPLGSPSRNVRERTKDRLFKVVEWMDSVRIKCGLKLLVDRAWCALVVTFHRWGDVETTLKIYDILRASKADIPACNLGLLLDMCLREGDVARAAQFWNDLRNVSKVADRLELVPPGSKVLIDGLPSWINAKEGHVLARIAGHAFALGGFWVVPPPRCSLFYPLEPIVHAGCSLAALPARSLFWVADHVGEVLGDAVVQTDNIVKEHNQPNLGFLIRNAWRTLMRPCQHLPVLASEVLSEEKTSIVSSGAKSASESLRELLRTAQANAIGGKIPDEELNSEIESVMGTRQKSYDVLEEPSLSEQVEGARFAMRTARTFCKQRRPAREDFDELFRTLAKRQSTRAGTVLAVLDSMVVLSVHGSAPLEVFLSSDAAYSISEGLNENEDESSDEEENYVVDSSYPRPRPRSRCNTQGSQDDATKIVPDVVETIASPSTAKGGPKNVQRRPVNLPANPHLAPDADTIATVIEAAFAVANGGGVALGEWLYRWVQQELVVNPAIFSAVMFGRVATGNYSGAAEAIFDMDAAGFSPHSRFLIRFLRRLGCDHKAGLEVMRRLGSTNPDQRRKQYHQLMEACLDGTEPTKRATEVHDNMRKDDIEPNNDTIFALVKALAGSAGIAVALTELENLQRNGYLPRHPALLPLVHENFMFVERNKAPWMFMESRRRWFTKALENIDDAEAEEVLKCTADSRTNPEGRLTASAESMLDVFCHILPEHKAAILGVQWLVWQYILVRSSDDRANLQKTLDELFKRSWRDRQEPFEPYAFVIPVLCFMGRLEVNESAQIRITRMLFTSAGRCNAKWHPKFLDILISNASDMNPDTMTEITRICPAEASQSFASSENRKKFAELVQHVYLNESIKLSTTVRFVRAHRLLDVLSDDVLMEPLLKGFVDGFTQHVFSMCFDDDFCQQRFVAYAIKRGERRIAGRLAERFGLHNGGRFPFMPPGWESVAAFAEECGRCVQEAEKAEADELRAANAKRISSAEKEDVGCLRLPEEVASTLILVSTLEELWQATERFRDALGGFEPEAPQGSTPMDLVNDGYCVGLDVEWRPNLEKRSGMQRHRRRFQVQGGQMEPCSTLQVSSRDFAVVFDLFSLAQEGSETAAPFSEFCTSLFTCQSVVKLGYGYQQDLQRLASSYPHLTCFTRVDCMFDVQNACLKQEENLKSTVGLSSLCAKYLGKPLTKRLQTSDWGARPLTRNQVIYAAMDAYCLIGLALAVGVGCLGDAHSLQIRRSSTGQMLAFVAGPQGEQDNDAKEIERLDEMVAAKGLEIRTMKQAGKTRSEWQGEVDILMQLKAQFKELAGVPWQPNGK